MRIDVTERKLEELILSTRQNIQPMQNMLPFGDWNFLACAHCL
jgi:hypothetical protein